MGAANHNWNAERDRNRFKGRGCVPGFHYGNFQFRSEFFNIFNHTNFSGVSKSVGAGNYGQVTSALDPRIIELALRFQL